MNRTKPITALVVILAMIALAACQDATEAAKAPYLTDAAQAIAQATESGKHALIYFYSPTCTWCDKLDTVVLTDQKVIDFFTNEMILAKVNGKEDTLLAQQHHIVAYPTLVMVDTNGDEVDRIAGYMEPDSLLTELRNYQKGIGTLADLLSKAEAGPDRSLSFEIAEKYHYRDGREEAVTWYQKVIDDGDPRDSLSGESRMAVGDMHVRAKEYDFAALVFTSIMNDFEGTQFAEDAEIWRAYTYRKKVDTTAAIAAFEEFIEHYPESEDIDYAEKQIKKLKGETEEEE